MATLPLPSLSVRPVATISKPWRARLKAQALPIPRVAPVIKATFRMFRLLSVAFGHQRRRACAQDSEYDADRNQAGNHGQDIAQPIGGDGGGDEGGVEERPEE